MLEECPAYADEREELAARIEHVARHQGMPASGAEGFRERVSGWGTPRSKRLWI